MKIQKILFVIVVLGVGSFQSIKSFLKRYDHLEKMTSVSGKVSKNFILQKRKNGKLDYEYLFVDDKNYGRLRKNLVFESNSREYISFGNSKYAKEILLEEYLGDSLNQVLISLTESTYDTLTINQFSTLVENNTSNYSEVQEVRDSLIVSDTSWLTFTYRYYTSSYFSCQFSSSNASYIFYDDFKEDGPFAKYLKIGAERTIVYSVFQGLVRIYAIKDQNGDYLWRSELSGNYKESVFEAKFWLVVMFILLFVAFLSLALGWRTS